MFLVSSCNCRCSNHWSQLFSREWRRCSWSSADRRCSIYVWVISNFNKLSHYGIDGSCHRWIKSFLSARTQKVMVDGGFSDAAPVVSGVPQGDHPRAPDVCSVHQRSDHTRPRSVAAGNRHSHATLGIMGNHRKVVLYHNNVDFTATRGQRVKATTV